ncbi:hypothetical protein [Streptomyces hygroscopicus]|uniref:Transposase n=2 Tax=Streptomyces hygroscopicus TaxID=1912 RepID=A0ABQ3U6V0_STRHY|nr:hypothetical protein [Streptomyces hygroscopicus]GHJ31314.1 hypothetical protein TPA0910_57470 [Streptomyces hygroscopicus]
MQHMPDDPSLLPAPWWVPDGGMHDLEVELRRELSPGHPLHEAEVTAAARCEGCDDILFRVANRPFPWAVVHLTWKGRKERAPWPMTTPLTSLAELLTEWADHGCNGTEASSPESRS